MITGLTQYDQWKLADPYESPPKRVQIDGELEYEKRVQECAQKVPGVEVSDVSNDEGEVDLWLRIQVAREDLPATLRKLADQLEQVQ